MRFFIKQIKSYWLSFAILFSLASSAFGSISVGGPSQPFERIGNGIEYFEDPSLSQTIDSIRKTNPEWKSYQQDVFNVGYSKSNWWVKFDIMNESATQRSFLLEVDYPVIDYLDVYFQRDETITERYFLGDKQPFIERPMEHRLFLIPFELEPGDSKTIFLRLNSSSSIQAPIKIWKPSAYQETDVLTNVIHGVYIGGMLIIGLYNLLIFIALRDKIYLYYVSYVFSMLLFLSSLNGWTFQYLWPESTKWNDLAILMFLNGVVLFTVVFANSFLELRKLGKKFQVQTSLWIVVGGSGFIAYVILPYSVAIKILIPTAALACFWTLSMGIYAWFKGQKSAGIYIISWTGILVGGVLLAMNKMHLLPRTVFTDQSVQLGSLVEVLLLSFALAERINDERAKRFLAQKNALDIQTKAKKELEANVVSRTKELEVANQKLKELSDTDQLTGLKNRRYLDQFIDQELLRATRYKHPVSVLLIDIDHFKMVNDTHGHLAGDACLKEVARRLNVHMRCPTDLCARYGGEEFCAVLPETDLAGAVVVAERIRNTINKQTVKAGDLSLTLSISVGVYSKSPIPSDEATLFLDKADGALYEAKNNGRNQVKTA